MTRPPRLASKLLRTFLRGDLLEEVSGDLAEKYEKSIKVTTQFKARLGYWRQTLNYLRPFALKKTRFSIQTNLNMFQHTLLIAFRSFLRYKSSFIINVAGLSIGLACSILIYLWIHDELAIDKFYTKDKQLFQVLQNFPDPSGIETGTGTAGILAEALGREIPEIEFATAMVPATWFQGDDGGSATFGAKRIKVLGQFVDTNFFNAFDCEFIAGDKSKALSDPASVVISRSTAIKLFGTIDNVVGRSIEWNQWMVNGLYQVTGVFEDRPAVATNQYDLLANYSVFLENRPWLKEWGNSDPNTFVVLREGTDPEVVNAKIKDFLKPRIKDTKNTLLLQRYSDRYLHGQYEGGAPAGGRIEYVKLFSIVAAFILLIACINFMNLSTAKASRRLKEVGIKKAIGAARKTLVIQYFYESALVTILSTVMALLMVLLFLPYFNELTGKNLSLLLSGNNLLFILGFIVVTAVVSGSYPALYLSGFRPTDVLKGKLPGSLGELWIRKGLVVFQFTISVLLIVSVVVVFRQIDFIQSKNLGYNRDNIVRFSMDVVNRDNAADFFEINGSFQKRVESFMNEVETIPTVISTANYSHDLMGNHGGLGGVDWEDGKEDEKMGFSNLEIGYEFIETLGIGMAEGRNFSRDYANEVSKIIFNETAIRQMGLKDPVGKRVRVWGQDKEIIGVAKDFNFESLYEKVKPCLMQLEPRSTKVMVKVRAGTESESLAAIRNVFEKFNPNLAFDYAFLDQDYQSIYVAEKRVSVLAQYFAGVAILISCLGLFGLSAFTAQRRTKEIGIRKVLGASDFGIVYLLSGDFTKMVLVAIVLALPISFLVSSQWLQSFAYKISLEWWFFLGAAVVALVTAWLSVGFQTWKAARVNPTECLKEQ